MSIIKIMSFNIRNDCEKDRNTTESWTSRFSGLVSLLKDADPDIIGFQEILINQYIDLVRSLPDYACVGVGRDDGVDGGERAAIFYKKERFTLSDTGHFWLSETTDRPSLGWDAGYIRICTYANLKDTATGKDLYHYNTHLDNTGKTAQIEGAKLIREAALKCKSPAIITGDFNEEEKSEPYNIMTSPGLLDVKFFAKSTMSYGTIHDYRPPGDEIQNSSPIDYIFVTENDFDIETYKVLVNGTDGHYTSDHYPIMAEIIQK